MLAVLRPSSVAINIAVDRGSDHKSAKKDSDYGESTLYKMLAHEPADESIAIGFVRRCGDVGAQGR